MRVDICQIELCDCVSAVFSSSLPLGWTGCGRGTCLLMLCGSSGYAAVLAAPDVSVEGLFPL